MAPSLSIVFTNAAEGRDEDFNQWYDAFHVPEVLENIPGFAACRRYRLNASQRSGIGAGVPSPWRYLALYELETDDLAETHRLTEEFKATGGFTPDGGSLAPGHVAWVYTSAGPRVVEVAADGKQKLGTGRHLFLAFTNPAPGRPTDFEDWYATHVPEVVAAFPGLVDGQLYRYGDVQRIGMNPRWQYLALYTLEADDVDEYHRLDAEVRSSGRLTPNDGALDPDFAVWVFSELAARIEAGRHAK